MFYQLKKYLKFYLKSSSKYGVHSPFVFDLVVSCFESKTPIEKIDIVRLYKMSLRNDKSVINVTDFGAGSRVFKTNERMVSKILKSVSMSTKESNLLIKIVSYFDCKSILEIGTSLGVGTLSLALGNKKAVITTLEGCAKTLTIPKNSISKYVDNEINFVEGEFSKTLDKTLKNKKYDLIYFDGNHQKQPTIDYFEACLQSVHNDSLFIFDDIYWSKEMTEAWNYIKNHDKVSLTIDTFHLGFVFFRKEQFQKEHFVIRL